MASPDVSGRDGGDIFQTWLVLEFCDRGSLSRSIRKGDLCHRDTAEPLLDHILLSALDVANAMNYLHSLGITHGDLKAQNVLLKSASTDRRGFFCKVSDFGLSRYIGNDDHLQTFTYGTITHMPPELLKNGVFSTAVDVYSFGILLWELLATTPPYPENNPGHILMTVVHEGRRPQITDRYPQMYADLIKDCWKQDAAERPKFVQIVRRLKGMLADLEIGNSCLRNVNDSATSQEAIAHGKLVESSRATTAADLSTIPDTSPSPPPCPNRPPNAMIVTDPTSHRLSKVHRERGGEGGASMELPRTRRQLSLGSVPTALATSPESVVPSFSDAHQVT